MRLSVLSRKTHYWASILISLPLLAILVTGLLLQLKKDPTKAFELRDLAARLAPTSLSEADVARHLTTFEYCGVVEREGERVRYRPGSAVEAHVDTLARLYIERPVTLFRVIYALRDTKIKTFSDAFKLR